jgi:hypothetical protein
MSHAASVITIVSLPRVGVEFHKGEGMTVAKAALIVFVGLLAFSVVPTGKAQQPTPSPWPHVDFPPLPPSIPELVAVVDLVIFGRTVASSGPQIELGEANRELVRRYDQVEILERLNGVPPPGQSGRIMLRQAGGTAQVGGRQVTEPIIQKHLEQGQSAILVLRKLPNRPHIYYVAYGPSGILFVDKKNMVGLPPQMQRMNEFLNRTHIPLDELLGLFRGVGK